MRCRRGRLRHDNECSLVVEWDGLWRGGVGGGEEALMDWSDGAGLRCFDRLQTQGGLLLWCRGVCVGW